MTSQQLQAAIVQPAALGSMSLTQFFQAVVAQGGVPGDFNSVSDGKWDRMESALAKGDLAAVSAIFAVVQGALSLDTQAAVQQVLQANTLRLIDVVARRLGVEAPESVSAEDVDAALGRVS